MSKQNPMRCPKVTLRSRPISHGRRSLYLDYYPAIRIPDTMKKTRTETLGIYVYAHPRTQQEKSHNAEMFRKARLIASERLPTIINKQYGFLDTARCNRDFLEYFRQIVGEHNSSLWKGCYNHCRFFVKNSCTCVEVDIELCRKFRSYLLSAHQFRDPKRPLAYGTIYNYYLKFRSLLHNAYRDHVIDENLALQVEHMAHKTTRREFLTPSELRTLSRTPCDIGVLKRASLFSCETGLRLSDIAALEWENIVPNTVYALVCRGEIPNYKQGRTVYSFEDELLEWIASGKVKTNEELRKEAERALYKGTRR